MWVTCNECNGTGYSQNNNIVYLTKNSFIYKNKTPCELCNPHKLILDTIMKGLKWVDDNHEPVSPPLSPRY